MIRKIGASSGPSFVALLGAASIAGLLLLAPAEKAPAVHAALLNPSYDPTRALYQEYDAAFVRHWRDRTGEDLAIRWSHRGAGMRAHAVIDGNEADPVVLASPFDVDVPHRKGLVPPDWEKRPQHKFPPYKSTIVFLVRKGNPKTISDWSDLVRPGVAVVTPDPKRSAGARWNYLGAWGYALRQAGGNETAARDFVRRLYANASSLDATALDALASFIGGSVGDVLIAREGEAYLALREHGPEGFEIVTPPVSILAEPAVAVLDRVVLNRNSRELANAYVEYLYSAEGQDIVGRHFYRPADPVAAERHAERLASLDMFTVDEVFGDWHAAQARHFSEGGEFDRIMQAQP